MKKMALKALSTAMIIALGVSISACSSEKEQVGSESGKVMAVDRVDAAADIARKNGPEAEDMAFPETAPMATADTETATAAADMPATTDTTDVASPAADAEPEALAADVGAQLYNNQCMACHQNGLLNAPKYGDAAAWAPRIAKGLDTLTMHSAKGFNQMPAQASNGVTEAQIHAAVEYMVAAAS